MGPNHRSGQAAAHVQDQIDLYLTGALDAGQEERFEEHLLRCADCQEQADRASEIAVAVAALPADLVAELERSATTSAGTAATGDVAGPTTARGTTGPATTRRDATGPAGRRPESRARRVLGYAAVLLVGLVLGVGGVLVYPKATADRVPVGDETGTGARGQLSITVTPGAGGTDVRAVAVGLRPGAEFDLLAVAHDGRNYVAAHGVAAGGPQTIVGTVPVARDQIRFFALAQGDRLLVSNGF